MSDPEWSGSLQSQPTNLHGTLFEVKNGVGPTPVLIARLGAGTGIDDGDATNVLHHGHMGMPENHKVVRERRKPGKLRAPR